MEHNFKPGDKLRCVNADSCHLKKGQVYECIAPPSPKYSDYVYVNNSEATGGWNPDRFKLVEPRPKPTEDYTHGNQFKVGDLVVWDASDEPDGYIGIGGNRWITKGKTYEVKKVLGDIVYVMRDDGEIDGWTHNPLLHTWRLAAPENQNDFDASEPELDTHERKRFENRIKQLEARVRVLEKRNTFLVKEARELKPKLVQVRALAEEDDQW